MESSSRLGFGKIALFWLPLAATWLMMSVEGPFISAVVARLLDPEINLAAFGVAFAVAIIVEAPIIMIMSASTALAKDAVSFVKLRSFTYVLSIGITALQMLLVFTPAFDFVALRLIDLQVPVAELTRGALVILLPWPGMIGYRRFYQGLLIRAGKTRWVAYGTVIRLIAMATTGVLLYLVSDLPGAYVGAAALSMGVTSEGICARFMARREVKRLKRTEVGDPLTYRGIIRFYYPLALTSTLSLAVQPMVTFFVGHSTNSLESLAVLPVINGLIFIFRSLGLAYQEVAIVLGGDRGEHLREISWFAALLAAAATGVLTMISFTSLMDVWYVNVSGLSPHLAVFAYLPTQILCLMPALSVFLSLHRAILVSSGLTSPLTIAIVLEVSCIISVLFITIDVYGMIGATAAAIALMVGRVACNLSLLPFAIKQANTKKRFKNEH